MDALQLLRDDHRKVKELFRQFEEAGDGSTRKAIADEAVAELMIHAMLEEEIFYPAMARAGMTDLVEHSEEEHQVAENLMTEIIGLNANDGTLQARFRVLSEVVREHIDEEESQMFPRAAETGFGRLDDIGAQIQRRRQELMTARPQPRVPADDAPKTTASGRSRSGSRTKAGAGSRSTSRASTGSRSSASTSGRRSTSGSTRSRSTRAGSRAPGKTSAGQPARTRSTGPRSRAGGSAGRGGNRTTSRRTTTARRNGGSRGGNSARGLDALTKEELYQRATRAGVEGRSQMNKQELVAALRNR